MGERGGQLDSLLSFFFLSGPEGRSSTPAGQRSKPRSARACFRMQPAAKSPVYCQITGHQIISMQKCAAGREAAAWM